MVEIQPGEAHEEATTASASPPQSSPLSGLPPADPSEAATSSASPAPQSAASPPSAQPTQSHTLLWSKSKVYVHPSPYARHNVPGYLALVRQGPPRPGATILLSFLPESLVEQRHELEKFVRIEYTTLAGGDSDIEQTRKSLEAVEVDDEPDDESELIAEPPASASYAFSLPITGLYSFTIKPPTISCWYGSVTLSQIGGVALPTLHFHDDESKSTILSMHRARSAASSGSPKAGDSSVYSSESRSSIPGASGFSTSSGGPPSPTPTWGGDELLHQLRKYAHVHRSVLDGSLFLVNPSRADLELHNTPLFDDDAIDPPNSGAGQPSNASGSGSSWRQDFPDDPFSPTYPLQGVSSRTSALHQSLPASGSPRKHDASMDNLTMWAKSTRLSVLSSFANLTQQARHASHAVLSHPLAKPYVPHLPGPVQSFAQAGPIPLGPNDGEWDWRKSAIASNSGTGEYYDSARVYLAKWARLVAEEGERNRRREERLGVAPGEGGDAARVKKGKGVVTEGGELGAFEVLEQVYDIPRPKSERRERLIELTTSKSSPSTTAEEQPRSPSPSPAMDLDEWRSLFDQDTGRPLHSADEIRHRVFVNGLTNRARREAWPFLLGVVPFDATAEERALKWQQREVEYHMHKARWQTDDALLDSEPIREQRHRIRVDCLRTDRAQPMFASPPTHDGRAAVAEGTASENDNVLRLGEILLTYGFWEAESVRVAVEARQAEAARQSDHQGSADNGSAETESPADLAAAVASAASKAAATDVEDGGLAGYVQGMSDLCSPLYVICQGDEVKTFWCFVGLMEQVKPNFYRDQSGMKSQLLLLQKLIAIMDPTLYGHLERSDSLNLFFCFRWLLVCFKREFSFDDTLKIWECIWASRPQPSVTDDGANSQETPSWGVATTTMPLFLALAILEIHRDVLLRYLENFDEILQYLNGLSQGGLDAEEVVARAEVLVKAFAQVVERAEEDGQQSDDAVAKMLSGFERGEIEKLVGRRSGVPASR